MKKYAIITSLLTIVAVPAYAAIDCATPPTCESLGYTDTKSSCKGKFLPCPLDDTQNTGICVPSYSCTDLGYTERISNCTGNYLMCPFSSSFGICLDANNSDCSLLGNRYYSETDEKCFASKTAQTNGYYIGNGYSCLGIKCILRFFRNSNTIKKTMYGRRLDYGKFR